METKGLTTSEAQPYIDGILALTEKRQQYIDKFHVDEDEIDSVPEWYQVYAHSIVLKSDIEKNDDGSLFVPESSYAHHPLKGCSASSMKEYGDALVLYDDRRGCGGMAIVTWEVLEKVIPYALKRIKEAEEWLEQHEKKDKAEPAADEQNKTLKTLKRKHEQEATESSQIPEGTVLEILHQCMSSRFHKLNKLNKK